MNHIMNHIKKKPIYWYLMALTAASAAGLQGWRTLYNNFAVDVVGLNGLHVGVIQSVREVPGFLALCAIFVLMLIREHRLSALSIILMGLGIALTGVFASYTGLIFTTPLIARAIKRFGERPILTAEYGSLIVIFTAYAYCPYKWVIMLLYILERLAEDGNNVLLTKNLEAATGPAPASPA